MGGEARGCRQPRGWCEAGLSDMKTLNFRPEMMRV